jgi:hypothetical protein
MLFALVRFNRRRLDGTYGPYIKNWASLLTDPPRTKQGAGRAFPESTPISDVLCRDSRHARSVPSTGDRCTHTRSLSTTTCLRVDLTTRKHLHKPG